MNKVHAAILKYIKEAMATDGQLLSTAFMNKPDEQIIRLMFSNYRGRDETARGLRLTKFGLIIMRNYFQHYEIVPSVQKEAGPPQLLFLEHAAKLPYHIDSCGKICMFDPDLGIRLKLVDGDIDSLIEAELVYRK